MVKRDLPAKKDTIFYLHGMLKSLLVLAVSFRPETPNFGRTFGGVAHPP